MKSWLVILAVAILALAFASPALAGGANNHGWAHGKAKFQLNGTVISTDSEAATMVVKVKCGSRSVKPWRGKELTISVPPEARIFTCVGGHRVVLTLADIGPGSRVHVGGRIDLSDRANPVFVAKRVKVKTPATYTVD